MATLLVNVADGQLAQSTPCPASCVGDLVDHVRTLTIGFTAVASKDVDGTEKPSTPSVHNLQPGWRERIIGDLVALADAWRDPAAWQGMTSAASVPLPGEVAGLVALDELIVHGWDIAVATGQPFAPSEEEIDAAMSFVVAFDAPRDGNLFGPIVDTADSAPPWDRLLGLTGRDRNWSPAR